MKQVGVYEAKTQLAKLLEAVERGETVTITRHGHPVAKLVPVDGERRRTVAEAIEAMREFRKRQQPLGDIKIKDLIEEGRRH